MGENFAFLLPVMMIGFGIAFLILWRWRMPAAGWWSASFFCVGLGFSGPLGYAALPGPLWSIVVDMLFAIGFFMFGQALLERWRPSWLLLSRCAICGLVILLSGLALYLENMALEVAACDIGCFLLIGLPLLVAGPHLRAASDRTLFVAAALVALGNLFTGSIAALTLSGTSDRDFLSSEYAFLAQTLACTFGLFLALSALATQMLDLLARYQREAMVDPLTGLLNRRGFDEAVARLVPGERRDGSLIVCDIDHFKAVNDEFGHALGDKVIVVLAEVLGKVAPSHAITARFGGEEFVLLLPETNAAHAAGIANEVRENFTMMVTSRLGLTRLLTASFGLSTIQRSDTSILEAVARADSALYEAKTRGRNRICVRRALFSPEIAAPRTEPRILSA